MLTGLELTFIGLTGSNSCLFSAPGFIVSPLGKRERRKKNRRREGGKKGIEKEWKEGMKEGQKEEVIKKIRAKIRIRNFNKK